MTEIPVVGPQT